MWHRGYDRYYEQARCYDRRRNYGYMRTNTKNGAIIASMPLPVLGGGVIVMFGMVAAAGLNVLSEIKMSRRNMIIIALSLSIGLGFNLVPSAVQYLQVFGKH